MKKNLVKDTYATQGMITGLFLGGIFIPVLAMYLKVKWPASLIGLFLLYGLIIGMLISKKQQKVDRNQDKNLVARVLTELIIVAIIGAAASIIVAGIDYATSTYHERHDDTGIKSGHTEKITFESASGSKTATFSAKPDTGTLYCDLIQKSEKKDTEYLVKWKLADEKSFKTITTYEVSKNKLWLGEKKCGSVKKRKKYDFSITKRSNTTTKSQIEFDWLLK